MANPTKLDIQAVKDAMAKTPWLNYVDAARQVRWVQNPVAPVAPTPAPITNQEVQQGVNAVWGTAEERRQTRTGIIEWQTIAPPPAETSVAPVAPTTPTNPVVQNVSTTPATTDATPWITSTTFQQAQAESEKIKAQNEAQMKLNTQQADLKAQERQQVAQETARANTPTNQKDVLNALVSGVSVAPQNTSAYRNAQLQYKNYQKFATMTPSQLVDNMKMGEIGTETAQLLASNPNYIKAKEDFDKFQKNQSINNMIKSVAEGATGKTTAVDHYQNASDAIAKKLGINETNADAFARIVSQDPETLQLTKTVSNIAKQLNTLNTERNAVYEDLKKQYPDLSASAIMTLMAWRTKEATAQIDALNSSLTLTQADLKMAMEMAKAEYDATKEDITLQAGLAKEDRAMQQALDLSQAQFDQKLAQQAQLTNDPVSAIWSVIKQFSDLGIIGDRDLAWHVAEQKRLGMTLPEYTKKMIEDFKAKPEYQQALAKKANEWVSFQTIGDKVYKVQNGQLVDTWISATKAPEAKAPEWKQDASGNWYNANSATSPEIQAWTLSPTSIAQYSTRLKWNNVQCWMVSNDYAAVKFPDAPRMGDSYESKIKTINSIGQAPIPQVWGLFVMDTWTSTGHTGIVTAVNWGGTFTATDANKSGSKDGWPLQTSTYKISDKVSFSNAPTGTTTTTWTVDVPAYQKYLNSWTLPTGLKAGTAKANEWLQGYSQWKSTANPLSESVQKRVDSYSDDYSKNPNVQSAFKFAPLLRQYGTVKVSDLSSSQRQGIISDYAKALDPDSVVREWEYATVAKYSSSFWEKTLSEINQFLSGNGTLSDAAAQKVIDAIKSRGKNYVEQEKNVRNQYIEKINRATGYKDWDMQLVYPDYSTQSTNPQKSDFLNSLKSIATEFTKGLTSIK